MNSAEFRTTPDHTWVVQGVGVPQFCIDFRQANRQLVTVTATGDVTFASDLTLDEAKHVITEIVKWKTNR